MRWIEEPNKTFPKWPHNVLTTEQNEPLTSVWVEYWKRILQLQSNKRPTPLGRPSFTASLELRTSLDLLAYFGVRLFFVKL